MSKTLVACFSATGNTMRAAGIIAREMDAELYEIKPEIPYSKADLNWLNPLSRTTKEMHSKKGRPAIVNDALDLSGIETVFLGFPIWWYIAPTIVNTFLESHDFAGKRIVIFASSGGSGFGKAVKGLQPSCPAAVIEEGMVFKNDFDLEDVRRWAKSLK